MITHYLGFIHFGDEKFNPRKHGLEALKELEIAAKTFELRVGDAVMVTPSSTGDFLVLTVTRKEAK